jgi:hypothetical protein
MKHLNTAAGILLKGIVFTAALCLYTECQPAHSEANPAAATVAVKNQRIKLALLLDTSNSMDGLIEQAKSQLWKIVNELAAAKCSDGASPEISIALYEYGNDGLSSGNGYIRQVSPLTGDLDVLSEKLFALTTNGGQEYCGHVIRTALEQLQWSGEKNDLKMIFIAGNEPFSQGSVSYEWACQYAKEKDVVVNTIFCGSFDEGIETSWKRGADLGGGAYMSIEQNRKTVYIATPYDDQISAKNDALNATYVYYGASGAYKKDQQRVQDSNAAQYGKANEVERTLSKSSKVYSNSSWDLIDASKDNAKIITDTKTDDLPQEMRSMTVEQRKNYVAQKAADRARIQAELQTLQKERRKYIETHTSAADKTASLDATMIKSLKEYGQAKNLSWK